MTGRLALYIGDINPFRYRGYFYDDETDLYYLQSRYYNPEMGRFICADDSSNIGANGTPMSYNLFAYSLNNPVSFYDPSGEIAITTLILIGSIVFGVATAIYTGYKMREAGADWADTIFYSAGAGLAAFSFVYSFGMSAYSFYCTMAPYYGYVPVTEIGNKEVNIPQEAFDTYDYVTSHNGSPKNGYKGGS